MFSEDSSVVFQVAARGIDRRTLRQFAHTLENEVARGRQFCCLITGDEELRRLNREFRKKDQATDVLSFPSNTTQAGAQRAPTVLLGEIAISFDRAKQQACELGHNAEAELQILMLHGVLHLTGLDHERDRGQMARAERRWRKRFGLPVGLIERAQP
jgi:probable rRNA maturation factor